MPHSFSPKPSTLAQAQQVQPQALTLFSLAKLGFAKFASVKRRLGVVLPSAALSLAIGFGGGMSAQAETPETAPPELRETLTQIDSAASQGDLQAVMQFYSPEFTHTDGLTYGTLEQALSAFWERYPDLTYQTSLTSWEADGDRIVAETTTTITGTQQTAGRTFRLESTISSRQRFEGQQIVTQEILTERSQVTSGDNPPTVTVNLPEQVATGQDYPFDAVVVEPLGDRILLGAAIEQPVGVEGYLTPTPLELEILSAGGLFKVGQAPASPENQWISAILIREDGITQVTQRLRVVTQSEQ